MRHSKLVFCLACLTVLYGCSSETLDPLLASDSNFFGNSFSVSHPFPPATARAVNIVNLRPEVSVGENTMQMNRNGDNWQGEIQVPEGSYPLTVTWFENLDGTEITLASAQREITMGDENQSVTIPFEEYNLDFDNDSDGFNNIEERRQNSDPFDPESPRTDGVNVVIPFVAPPEAPVVDGFFDSIWSSAQYNDIQGTQLSIDNLIVGADNTRSDGNTEFQWAAIHDDENLYIMVFYENVDSSALFFDSEQAQDDDSLDIYWDGSNNSKGAGSAYDGVDDYLLRIPLLKTGGGANLVGNDDTRFEVASVSAPYTGEIDFFNCFCSSGRHIWEIKIPVAGSGITPRAPFGFEIQINDDQDGGSRDAKWAWFEPSNNQTEDAESSPSVFGTALLE